MTFLINPNFLCRSLTGIERFAFEVCARLDTLLTNDDDIRIVLPENAKTKPSYKNIKIIPSEKLLKSFPIWDMIEFKKLCKRYGATGINFSNTSPLGKSCGISFIHDIYAKEFPQDFTSTKEKLVRLYSMMHYRNIAKNAIKVLTVSEFSKKQISRIYKITEDRIEVIPNGWEHFKSVEPSPFEENDAFLAPGTYYFTLGSLQKRKNLGWILEYAKNHPQEKFAISGKAVSGFVSGDIQHLNELPNVRLLGYVSDSQVKYLMQNCRAFVFPSYYEGFGIPPLEALSVGAKIVVGNAASLPEIYKDCAVFINPYDSDCNLSALLATFEKNTPNFAQNTRNILEAYSYDKAAQKLHALLKSL